MFKYPESLEFSITGFFDTIVDWILINLSELFDLITIIIANMFNGVEATLSFIPWWVIVIFVFYFGKKFYSYKMATILGLMTVAIGMFGLWESMIYTIAIVIISVTVSLLVGLPIGIIMAKNTRVERVLQPILDAMQTMPSFVYLIPAVMLFGLGRVPAVFATTIYAIPPLIRLTYLGISNVNKEVLEAGQSFGSTSMQMLFKIELPQSMSTIMTGVNQTTMMAMAMVVISSMIGADGIGQEVLISIRRLEVGRGFQAGFAIVFLAIIMDRLLQGLANSFEGGVSTDE
ncbi:MAG: ABC transporter permease subunit [Melioribacteraceae bacterium]|jgi:glycine betaine/proline transport system permease protein|nr:ABC transporter permease subunit [Melioribacteraceae bacterium]